MSTRSIKLAQVWCISLDRWRCFRGTHRFFFGDGFWATFENGRFVELKNPWFKIAWSKTSEIRCLSQSLMIGKGDHSIGSINVLTVQEALLELYRIVMKWSKTALQSAPPVQDMEMGKTAKPQKLFPWFSLCASSYSYTIFIRCENQGTVRWICPCSYESSYSDTHWLIGMVNVAIFTLRSTCSLVHWHGHIINSYGTVILFSSSSSSSSSSSYGAPQASMGDPAWGFPGGDQRCWVQWVHFWDLSSSKLSLSGWSPWTGCITCRNLAMKFYLRSPWHRLLCACWTLSDAHYSASSADAGALERSSSGSPTGIGLVLERDWFDWNLNPRSWPDWPDDKKSVGCVTCPFLADQK